MFEKIIWGFLTGVVYAEAHMAVGIECFESPLVTVSGFGVSWNCPYEF